MFRPRIIPVLLLKKDYLVKTVCFKKPNYLGDPINAVRIFNDLKADELVFLDIDASKEKRLINLELVKAVSEEANMPFSVGGGIRSIEDIRLLLSSGAERVVLGSIAVENADFVRLASEYFGSSTISVCLDTKKKRFVGRRVYSKSGKVSSSFSPVEFAKLMESKGAGEIILQNIERDGKMEGYDLDLIKSISKKISIPVVALGGAANYGDLALAYSEGYASAVAAGSIFVYQGKNKGVLISYPENSEINFSSEQ